VRVLKKLNCELMIPFFQSTLRFRTSLIVPRHARDSRRSGQSLSERVTGLYNDMHHQNTQGASRPNRCEKRHLFLSLSLCLSRACLGKMIVFIYKLLQNGVFLTGGRSVARRCRCQCLAACRPPDSTNLVSAFLMFVPSLSWLNDRFYIKNGATIACSHLVPVLVADDRLP
jgi:hypothetical protein